MWASVGFVYSPVSICPLLSLWIITSKNLTDSSLAFEVNLIVSWTLFRAERKEYNSVGECGHTMKMSSIYLHHTSGRSVRVARNSSSIFPINMIAIEGAQIVPMVVPDICSYM